MNAGPGLRCRSALPEMTIGQVDPNPANFHLDPGGQGSTHSLDPAYRSNQKDLDLAPRAEPDEAWPGPVYDDLDALEFGNLASSVQPFPWWPLLLSVSR